MDLRLVALPPLADIYKEFHDRVWAGDNPEKMLYDAWSEHTYSKRIYMVRGAGKIPGYGEFVYGSDQRSLDAAAITCVYTGHVPVLQGEWYECSPNVIHWIQQRHRGTLRTEYEVLALAYRRKREYLLQLQKENDGKLELVESQLRKFGT